MGADPDQREARTGVTGLDDVLGGGFSAGHLFLVEGNPGTGKTTLALRFLLEGAKAGERGLHVTLSETAAELRAGAASHGWTLPADMVQVFELTPPESLLDPDQQQSLLYSSDLELGETTRAILKAVEDWAPQRLVVDSLSELRLLAQSSLRYRRQVLALKHFFDRRRTTVLLLDDLTAEHADRTIHSVVHGVVRLEDRTPSYGAQRRRLQVVKYRGRAFRGGFHDFAIRTGGIEVYPRLVAAEHRRGFARDQLSSGIDTLDELLGGGLERGSSTLILGPAGCGKTLLTLQFAFSAMDRGERAALFIFDEELGLLFDRAKAMGLDLEAARQAGPLLIEQVDAAEMTPGEFAHRVRRTVADDGVRTVVIDSLNGYQAAMAEESSLVLHMHELLQYMNRQSVTTFLTVAQHGLIDHMVSPVDITYLADTVILLRYFEAFGEVRRAVSIVKKRTSGHETTIRELKIGADGLAIGAPLVQFQGVLKGAPTYTGQSAPLLDTDGG